jgi:hypothetical protein
MTRTSIVKRVGSVKRKLKSDPQQGKVDSKLRQSKIESVVLQGKMECEKPYRELRKLVQTILQTGTQAYGEASTFAEMNEGGTEEILDTFFPTASESKDAVVMDIGSGLGNFPFRAALQHGARVIGIEFNRELHMQTVSLLQAMLQDERFAHHNLAQKCFFTYGDAENLCSLEGVTHLYMFNKNMPYSIFINLAAVAARSRSLRYVVSHYDLSEGSDCNWQNLTWVKNVSSTLTGSGAGVVMRVYRVNQPSTSSPKLSSTLVSDEVHHKIQPPHALEMMKRFAGWSVKNVVDHWVHFTDDFVPANV